MRSLGFAGLLLIALGNVAIAGEYRITRDYGGSVDQYIARYAAIRDSGERVVIDGVCNSACTLLLGIVPIDRICVTPRASLGFHMPYYDTTATHGVKVVSYQRTAEMMSLYPESVHKWIVSQGGLSAEMKIIENGPALWAIVRPCSDHS